jgi:hypothetical protein
MMSLVFVGLPLQPFEARRASQGYWTREVAIYFSKGQCSDICSCWTHFCYAESYCDESVSICANVFPTLMPDHRDHRQISVHLTIGDLSGQPGGGSSVIVVSLRSTFASCLGRGLNCDPIRSILASASIKHRTPDHLVYTTPFRISTADDHI